MLKIVEDWPARSGNYANDATFRYLHLQVKYDQFWQKLMTLLCQVNKRAKA